MSNRPTAIELSCVYNLVKKLAEAKLSGVSMYDRLSLLIQMTADMKCLPLVCVCTFTNICELLREGKMKEKEKHTEKTISTLCITVCSISHWLLRTLVSSERME